jgi:hypothetical protein
MNTTKPKWLLKIYVENDNAIKQCVWTLWYNWLADLVSYFLHNIEVNCVVESQLPYIVKHRRAKDCVTSTVFLSFSFLIQMEELLHQQKSVFHHKLKLLLSIFPHEFVITVSELFANEMENFYCKICKLNVTLHSTFLKVSIIWNQNAKLKDAQVWILRNNILEYFHQIISNGTLIIYVHFQQTISVTE